MSIPVSFILSTRAVCNIMTSLNGAQILYFGTSKRLHLVSIFWGCDLYSSATYTPANMVMDHYT